MVDTIQTTRDKVDFKDRIKTMAKKIEILNEGTVMQIGKIARRISMCLHMSKESQVFGRWTV